MVNIQSSEASPLIISNLCQCVKHGHEVSGVLTKGCHEGNRSRKKKNVCCLKAKALVFRLFEILVNYSLSG